METLKRYHVPFQAKVWIDGMEIDFVVGRHAIEIDGHPQKVEKNQRLLAAGYIPVHLMNSEASSTVTAQWLITLYNVRNISLRATSNNR